MKTDINSRQLNKPISFRNKAIINQKSLEEQEILMALDEARREWQDAIACFEHAYEENMVDYYTYKMKACESRYGYFIKKAKEVGVNIVFPQKSECT